MMAILLIAACLIWILGIVGCFLPILPGPFLAWLGMFLLYFLPEEIRLHGAWIAVAAVFMILVTLLDFILPGKWVKRKGGSTHAIRAANIGALIGIIFGPIGIILGPIVGAMAGELMAKKNFNQALHSGIAAGLSFVVGTGIKLMVSLIFGIFIIRAIWLGIFQA